MFFLIFRECEEKCQNNKSLSNFCLIWWHLKISAVHPSLHEAHEQLVVPDLFVTSSESESSGRSSFLKEKIFLWNYSIILLVMGKKITWVHNLWAGNEPASPQTRASLCWKIIAVALEYNQLSLWYQHINHPTRIWHMAYICALNFSLKNKI